MCITLGIRNLSNSSQKLLAALSVKDVLDLAVIAKVDAALSAYLDALTKIKTDIGVDIGHGYVRFEIHLLHDDSNTVTVFLLSTSMFSALSSSC